MELLNSIERILGAAILTTLFVPIISAAQRSGADILSPGVTVRGNTEFKRETAAKADTLQQQTDTMLFYVNLGTNDGGSSALIRLMAKYALDRSSVSSNLYAKLLPGGNTTIRFAELADLPTGASTQPESVDGVLQCRANLGLREARQASYDLRCFSIDDDRRARNDTGVFIFEVDMVVHTPNQSPVDQFLLRHDWGLRDVNPERSPFVYVRVEK
jgi:hypothetical protein